VSQVSVLLPVRNAERFLREAVDSVLGQTLADLELVVVDDGSTDGTAAILASYDDPRLRVLSSPGDGLVCALNHGLEHGRAPYVARMDADDVSLPQRLERQVDLLEREPRLGLVATWVSVIDAAGRELREHVLPERHGDLARRLLLRNPFQHGSVVLRRSVLDRVGPYRGDYGHNEDYDLWRRLARVAELGCVPETLYRYRVHGEAVTQQDRGDRVERRERLRDELWTDLRDRDYRLGDVARPPYRGQVLQSHTADQRALAREALRRRRYRLAAKALAASAALSLPRRG
jgi:glycosyltransferase involved in cell wall biosynthesis